jgi:hypothetical protein
MTSAVVHIGLPKTGTTSFQSACRSQADALADAGVLYPLDDWLTFGDALQHQALAVRLSRGTPESIEEDVRQLREQTEGYDALLLSAERMAALLHEPANAPRMKAFRESLNRHFDRVEFVCAIRSDRSILKSTLKTKIDGQGMRADGSAQIRREIAGFYFMNRAIVETFGEQLKVLRFEDLIADRFPRSLFRACVGFDVDLPEERRNASDRKDATRFLLSNIRLLLVQVLGEPTPNTPKVNRATREFEQGIAISPEVHARLREMIDGWIEKEVDAALRDSQESLEAIYAPYLMPTASS